MKIKFFIILFFACYTVFAQSNSKQQNTTITAPCSIIVYLDNDQDGYGVEPAICADDGVDENYHYALRPNDCDDNNPNITTGPLWFKDNDGDGIGGTTVTKSCTQPLGYVAVNGDCNDFNASITINIWYQDADNDGFGNPNVSVTQCTQPVGYVNNNSDCNDTSNTILAAITWYQDADNDSYGNPAVSIVQCTQPAGYVKNNKDCNDANPTLNISFTWYADADGDGFGDPNTTTLNCIQPNGYVSNNLDECPSVAGPIYGCVIPISSTSFGNDQNYILTVTPKIATSDIETISSINDVVSTIVYYDGLGRPMQKILNGQSNSGKDIITHIEYDSYGRQKKEFLPYPSTQNNLAFVNPSTAQANTLTHYQGEFGDMNPFEEKEFEPSPLNRVLKQAASGNDWALGSGHEIKYTYDTNTASEVKLFIANATWNTTLGLFDVTISNTSNYAAGELFKTITKDENWILSNGTNGTSEEFKNKEGKVVLKRYYNENLTHDTYYVYDQYNNLTYVIPPAAEGAIDANTLNGLCYQYKYDDRNRLVEKKLPGKQWEYLVYDKLDRVVATGPTLSPFTSPTGFGWLYTKYDVFNRAILTAWQPTIINSTQRKTLQNSFNAATINYETKTTTATTVNSVAFNYTNVALPTSGYHVLTVNYFDDYVFPNVGTIPTTVEGQTVFYNNTQKPKGLSTGSWVRIPETITAPFKSENTVTFYDEKARPIRVRTTNHLLGYTETDKKLDFIGKNIYTVTRHKRDNTGSSTETVTKEEFSYSPQDRLLTQTHQITSGSAPKQYLANNTYNDLGQLITKKVGGTGATSLQKVDYKYNIKGWLKEINNVDNLQEGTNPRDLFAFKINYNDNLSTLPTQEIAVPQLFDGNISEIFWRTANDDKKRKYGFVYDDLNRLTNAVFQEPSFSVVTNSYNENITYDKNGNIKTLTRNDYLIGFPYNTQIDNLTYTYHTVNKNQLIKVSDASLNANGFKDGSNNLDDYTYDNNGNMLTDLNKSITTNIVYNHLNLPTKIVFPTGNIEYLYNAIGQKIQKKVTQSGLPVKTTLYLQGGYQYIDNNLEFMPTAEGYVKYVGGVFSNYVYNYTDHLGNVRLSYQENGSALQILEENNYYPFGLKHNNYNNNNLQPNYKYKYNGQEWQDELGLNLYDYDNRIYDPTIGRFIQMDPKGELGRRWSPYNYCFDNPIYFRDPDGMWPDFPLSFKRAFEGAANGLKQRYNEAKSYVSNQASKAVNWVKNHGVIQVEAKATVGAQIGVKTPFGSAGAGVVTTDIGKVGASNTKGVYAKKGDGKGHNFAEANVKVLDKKLGVGAKVDWVNDTVLPNGNGNGSNGNTDLLKSSSYQGKLEWEANAGPGKSGPGFSDGVSGDISVPAVKYKASGSNKDDCKTCFETSFGAKAILGVEIKVKVGFK